MNAQVDGSCDLLDCFTPSKLSLLQENDCFVQQKGVAKHAACVNIEGESAFQTEPLSDT